MSGLMTFYEKLSKAHKKKTKFYSLIASKYKQP